MPFTLAFLYGVETRRLNEQVKRNIERFPSDFMFQLTKEEFDFLKSQFAMSNITDSQDNKNLKSQLALQNLALLVTKTVYVYSLLFVPEYLEQLYKRIAVEGEPLAYSIYFFVTFDHGLRQMADVFSKQMVDGQSTSFTAEMFRMCLRAFIAHSLTSRTDTKEGWQQLANETSSDDCWKEIMFTLRSCQSHDGQQKDSRTLDELLLAVRDFTFHDALRRLPMTIDNRKLWHGFSQILLPEGKGRFCLIRTEYRGHSTAAIYLCIAEK